MDCRGEDRRRWIVQNYKVRPIAHVALLNGQSKKSDAGREIEKEYYKFEVISNQSGKKELIICGMGAARHFLELTNEQPLPLFNPLVNHIESDINNNVSNKNFQNNRDDCNNWDVISKQLYNACMWIILIIDAEVGTPIYDIKDKIQQYKIYPPYESIVKSVNTIIKKLFKGVTLTSKIEELAEQNDLKNEIYDFGLIRKNYSNMEDTKEEKIILYF